MTALDLGRGHGTDERRYALPDVAVADPIPDVRRIGVLAPDDIGEYVMAMPALHALDDAYPDAQLALLGSRWHERLLADRPGPVDEVTVLGSRRIGRYDLLVDLRGPVAGRPDQPLYARHTVDADSVPYLSYQHQVVRSLAVAGRAGAHPTELEPRLAVTAADHSAAKRALSRLEGPLVAIHPGGSDPRRRWPAERFAEVAQAAVDEGASVALLGTDAEAETVADMVRALGQQAMRHVRGLTGALSLSALLGVLDNCVVAVGNDSGPLHLAQAVGTPTVGVYWGGTVLNTGPFDRDTHRTHPAWTIQCPVCGVDVTQADCGHAVSLVAELPVDEVAKDVVERLRARTAA